MVAAVGGVAGDRQPAVPDGVVADLYLEPGPGDGQVSGGELPGLVLVGGALDASHHDLVCPGPLGGLEAVGHHREDGELAVAEGAVFIPGQFGEASADDVSVRHTHLVHLSAVVGR